MKLEAAHRLVASSWTGRFEIELPVSIEGEIKLILTSLSRDYPSISHINVNEGDAEIMGDWQLASKSATALYLNPAVWKDKSKLDKYTKEWHEAMVDPTIQGTIVHEVGHILDGQVLRKLGSKKYNALIVKEIRDVSSIWNDEAPSAYGQENVAEFLAEAFAAHYLGKHALERPNDLTVRSLKVCNAIWDQFDKLLGRV